MSSPPVLSRVVLSGVLLLAACAGRGEEALETSEEVPVKTAAAHRGTIRAVVEATGIVRSASGAELLVLAPEAARIVELPKAAGDLVRQGELVARFEIPAIDTASAGRDSDVARSEARLDNARSALQRVEGLFDRGIAARKEVEDARRELAEATASFAEARRSRQAARQLAARETVRAPFAGIVAERWHNPGDLVEASNSDPVLRLVDPDRLEVEAAIPVPDVAGIAVGNPAWVTGPGDAPREAAQVRGRPAAVDLATGTAPVRLAFAHPSLLPVGTPVAVRILAEERRDVVLVPAAAIVREGGDSFLYSVDDSGHAHRRQVQLGIVNEDEAEIASGLEAGEHVVVHGQAALPDGAAVTPES
ncbi:MAG TPA: efflux RND transporter periplasmic adaptor subunit [Candidatus Polarisedimenticolaceae bacterium]|nr:efflux RND transporter periplasmic adaptor subunit [Candidatus Polarisedimenticolaceae bacterium]